MSSSGCGSCEFKESNPYFADNDLGSGAISYLNFNGQKFMAQLWWLDWNHFEFRVVTHPSLSCGDGGVIR